MRLTIYSLLGAFALLVAATFHLSARQRPAPDTVPMELLVPAYFYPANEGLAYWENIAEAARKAPVTAIFNPGNGPGQAADPRYGAALEKARQSGTKVIGYVSTAYGARPLIEVVRDMDRYLANYTVDGFFIDEMATEDSKKNINYYLAVYSYAKGISEKFRVVMNAGTAVPEAFVRLPLGDTIVTFEDKAPRYRRAPISEWVNDYGNGRFAHLIYGANTADAASGFVRLAQERNVAYIYVTRDRGAGNPWDSLPPYWSDLVREVCLRNDGKDC